MKTLAAILVILLHLGARAMAHAQTARTVAELVASEPSVERVRAAAVSRSQLRPERAPAWASRARLAGLLPQLALRATRSMARDEDVKSTVASGERLEIGLGNDLVLEARATWDLDRLAFDPAELRAAREGARLAAERLDLEAEVTRLYYQRRRAQIEMILNPPQEADAAARRQLEVEELTSLLDALTGGFLSTELARRMASPR